MIGGRRVKHTTSNETTTTSMVTDGITNRSDNNVVVSTVQPTTTQQVSFSLSLSLSLSLFLSLIRCASSFSLRRRVSRRWVGRATSRGLGRAKSGSLSRGTRDSSAKCRVVVWYRTLAHSTFSKLDATLWLFSEKKKRSYRARLTGVCIVYARRV